MNNEKTGPMGKMKRYFLFYPLFFAALIVLAAPVQAQRHEGYCDGSRTTADALACVNQHKDDVQERLNNIFDQAKAQSDEKSRALLTEAQNAWISYRNAQCLWEAGLAKNPSLERIYELSCVTLLTNLRSDLLTTTLETENNERPREFGSTPRWMNVLIHDYPDVFWKFGRWQHVDLDCNNSYDEQVVLGVRFAGLGTSAEKSKKQDKDKGVHVILAIAQNPLIGKPATELVSLSLQSAGHKKQQGLYLCDTDVTLSPVSYPRQNEQADVQLSCQGIKIESEGCAPLYLYKEGKRYRVADKMPQKQKKNLETKTEKDQESKKIEGKPSE